jgi:hypothetical protein
MMSSLSLLLVVVATLLNLILATSPAVHRECPRSTASQCARLKFHGCGMAAADRTKAACTCGGGFTAAADGCVPCTQVGMRIVQAKAIIDVAEWIVRQLSARVRSSMLYIR